MESDDEGVPKSNVTSELVTASGDEVESSTTGATTIGPGAEDRRRAQSLGLPALAVAMRAPKLEECRRNSSFQEMMSTAFSEESRLNEEKAAELESRLKNLVSAFSKRVKKTEEEIRRPPTPSSEESESDISTATEVNLNQRLKIFSPDASSEEQSRQRSPALNAFSGRIVSGIWRGLKKVFKALRCDYVVDPQSSFSVSWLILVSLGFLYNAWVLPLRAVFPYQTDENLPAWIFMDSFVDVLYLIDMLLFKCHNKFIQQGFWIKATRQTLKYYFFSKGFAVDLIALFPLDIFFTLYYTNTPWFRLPRLLKVTTFWELFRILDIVLSSPHSARIARTLLYMLYMIHLNASAYYALSKWEGINATDWTYDGDGNAYVRCFYFATKTATSIGKNPKPENEIEYMFMTCAWLSGVFVFAVLIGQIRDIIATATKTQTEYRQVCYATDSYLHRFDVPSALQQRVKSWLSYTWEQQKTLDESKILALLPQKMQADIALHVHIDTLSKVKLFQNCEVAFLRDLVVKLRSIIFLPGDFVCRKGEVGKEMYIVKTGKVQVVGGPSGTDVLVTLQEGAVFGEIALLAIGGVNRRTADVRAAGFSNLFVLSKGDLNEAIKDYPLAQESMRRKAKKIIREQAKKSKAQDAAQKLEASLSAGGSLSSIGSENLVIKDKARPPKLLNVLMRAIPKNSKTALYIKFGSKANSSTSIYPSLTSYPPSPFLPTGHLADPVSVSLSCKSNSSDEDANFPSLPDDPILPENNQATPRPETSGNGDGQSDPWAIPPQETRDDILDSGFHPVSPPEKEVVDNSNSSNVTEALTTTSHFPPLPLLPDVRIEGVLDIDSEMNTHQGNTEDDMGLEQTASLLTLSSRWMKKSGGLKRQSCVDVDLEQGLSSGDEGKPAVKSDSESP